MITVNTNMASIIAQNSLYKSTNKMNTALQRLSTGLRINRAKDDAAGSAISTKLEYKVSSYDVAKDNTQMGQSMLDTANGTLSSINSMLQRMRDLSEQAANGTYGDDERKAMQSEINALTEEIYRIKNTTEFNGKKILGEEEKPSITSIPTMSINDINLENLTQAEWDNNYKGKVFGISNAKELQKLATIVNDKKINTTDTTFALTADIDLNELDFDKNGSNWVPIGNDWSAGLTFSGIFDGNGYTVNNLKLNDENKSQQGFFGSIKNATIKNLNLDNISVTGKSYVGGLCGFTANGEISNCTISGKITGTGVIGGMIGGGNPLITDCAVLVSIKNGGGFIGGAYDYGTTITIKNSYFGGAFEGNNNSVFINGLSTGKTVDIENCAYCPDVKSVKMVGSNPSGTIDVFESNNNPFKNNSSISVMTNLQVGIDSSENSVISVDTGFSIGDFNISVLSDFSARNALDTIDNLMAKVTDKLTDIGSTQNRLMSTMEFQEVQRQALTSANSLIKDADIALESANYIKNQILQSVTSSILATANQNPQIALQLI